MKLKSETQSSLTIIMGAARLLKETPLNAEQRNYVNDILYAADALCSDLNITAIGEKNTPLSKRVLVVEDVLITQELHQKALLTLGCEVDTASSVTEALTKVENHYDLILLDIGLLDGSGIDVAKAFRANPKHRDTKIIAITVFGDENTKQQCFAAGVNELYVKPIFSKQLQRIVLDIFSKETEALSIAV